MELSGKTVVYIGGFGGIGFATCKILASKGVKHLIVLDLKPNAAHLAELKTLNSRTHFIAFDITSDARNIEEVLTKIYEKFYKIDVLVNGAGITGEAKFGQTIAVNLQGPISVIVALMKMRERSAGRSAMAIVSIASYLAMLPFGITAVYCATKAGLLMFSQCCAQFCEDTGMSFSVVCPAMTDTPIVQSADRFMNSKKRLTHAIQGIPMQTADVCAQNIVKVIEVNRNGSVWILASGALKSLDYDDIWRAGIQQCE